MNKPKDDNDLRGGSPSQRVVEAVTVLVIWIKFLYYMQLVDEMAPIVHIIFQILFEIRYFILVLIIAICGFANSFYLIGKN